MIAGVTCLSAHFTFGAVCCANVIQKFSSLLSLLPPFLSPTVTSFPLPIIFCGCHFVFSKRELPSIVEQTWEPKIFCQSPCYIYCCVTLVPSMPVFVCTVAYCTVDVVLVTVRALAEKIPILSVCLATTPQSLKELSVIKYHNGEFCYNVYAN
jgi:hypothetical protein